MSPLVRWSFVALAVAVVTLVWLGYFQGGTRTAAAGPAGLEGSLARSFTVRNTSGREVGLKDFAGKTIVLNLWASWCPPCRAEMPDLERLWLTQRSHSVVVIGVDQGESSQRAASFARSLGITYPILIDDGQQYGGVYAALGLPSTYVIDPHGIIVRGFDGPLTFDQMRGAVRDVR
jgi:peroxiredoxin